MTRLPVAILFILGLIVTSCSVSETPPNVLLILVDDMGYGDVKSFNSDSKIPTPTINKLAEEGMFFTDAHATGPLCHLSRYGLMTGRYPFRTDVTVWPKKATIEESRTTVPSLLKSQGYHTAMVGKWHLGFNEKGYDQPLKGGPVDRGFDSFFGIRASTDIPPYFYIRNDEAVVPPTDTIEAHSTEGWSPIQGEFWRKGGIAPGLELKDVLPKFTAEAIDVIKSHARGEDKDKPLMLYLAYPSPHTPWLPSKEFQGSTDAGMYGDFVAMVDANISKVLTAMKDAGLMDNTLVIFSSDNGPVWYDKDVEKYGHDCAGGLRGMKGDVWEAGHRVPFIVKWPGKVKAGSTSDHLVCFTDVLATLADVTGAKIKSEEGPDSFSFLPAMLGNDPDNDERPPVVLESASGTKMIRSGDWKYIDHLGSGGFSKPSRIEPEPGDPAGQLYNLKEDLAETNNLYSERMDMVVKLKAEMEKIISTDERKLTE